MPNVFSDAELQLRKKLLRRMRQFNKDVYEPPYSAVVDTIVDVDEELNLLSYDCKEWNIEAWLCFIDAMQIRLKAMQPRLGGSQGAHVAEALERLAKMREEIDVERVLGRINLRDPLPTNP